MRGPTLCYVHTDHLGRPARMIAQNWAWVWDVIYAPFGAASAIFDATTRLDMRFPGQWFQLESGLAYNWHRHYDASLGRYVQPDPIGYAGGRSVYGYVGQNPIARIDPDGRNQIAIIGVCIENPVICGALAASAWCMSQRPASITRLEERLWDRKCNKEDDPCNNLKSYLNDYMSAAKNKMDAMIRDGDTLLGRTGWITHGNDLQGRIDNINAMISLGKKIPCDMSAEEIRAREIFVPSKLGNAP